MQIPKSFMLEQMVLTANFKTLHYVDTQIVLI
jgi:hypothetical protein